MVGILSKNEVLYAFVYQGMYRCFIHPLGAEAVSYTHLDVYKRQM